MTTFRAVLFDLGGVVLGSPLHAIARYEEELGIPANFINRVVADTAPHGGWARLERGEISMIEFYEVFEADCRNAGHGISAQTMMEKMAAASEPRQAMLQAISILRSRAFKVAALTNNWASEDDTGPHPLREHFDVFVESSVEGVRKPDPRIYGLTCDRLAAQPSECIFLDDIGSNLKTARSMGIATIKVNTPESALQELEELVGFALRPD
jgi:putative hydrolase of the HAD superfamily